MPLPLAEVPPIVLYGRPLPEPVTVFLREWVWWTFTNGFSVSLVLPGVLLFLGLVLFHRFGSSLGLPTLFWRAAPRSQFMVGIGVGALIFQVLLAGYLFEEFTTNFTVDRPPFCEIRPYDPGAGIDHEKFPGRFRSSPTSIVSVEWYALVVLASAAAITLTVIAFVIVLQYIGQFVRRQLSGWKPYQHPRHEPRVGYAVWLPLGAVAGWVAMSVVTTVGFTVGSPVTGKTGEAMLQWAGWGNAAARQAHLKELIQQRERGLSPNNAYAEKQGVIARSTARDWFLPYAPVYGTFVLNFLLILVVSLVLIGAPPHLRFFTPAVGIILLLNILVFGHVVLTAFPPLAVSGDFFLLCLFTLVVLAGRAYKFRFPNMPAAKAPIDLVAKYAKLADIEARVTAGTLTREGAADELCADAGECPTHRQVFSDDITYPNPKVWSGPKPPMVIVCASGGGSRSAAWTMKVLLDLEERFLNPTMEKGSKPRQPVAFPYHVRLVSGASGGMIGASYYVASLAEPPGGMPAVARNKVSRPGRSDAEPLTPREMFEDVCRDFLTPATHTLVNHDLVSLFVPVTQSYDRGQALEDALKVAFREQLHVPFVNLRPGEAAGWRPSLIFSPMLVEDGRQLFISNLGLRSVTQNRAFVLGESDTEAPTDTAGFALLSREGVEFFKLFPNATEFTLATAARMSASFPYVMPAVSLPTNPPRRVVDAGYYDNFGVGIVASWLFTHMEWVKQHTSGVVIVQIRDGVSEAGRKREEVLDSFPTIAQRGLQWLTTPPAGLWSSRMAANAFRNDNLIHLLNDFFLAKGFPRGFFATAAFELEAGDAVALNFTLSENEIAAIKQAVEKPAYKQRAESLVNWFHARLGAPHATLSLTEVDTAAAEKV
jgi:predicted acylesterase/phospholipase RssA